MTPKRRFIREIFSIITIIILSFIAGIITYGIIVNDQPDEILDIVFADSMPQSEDNLTLDKADYLFMTRSADVWESEVGFCLKSRKDKFQIARTLMVRSNESQIEFKCPDNTIMQVHTHPNGVCQHSQRDINNFMQSHHYFSGVTCGYNRSMIINRNLEEVNLKLV